MARPRLARGDGQARSRRPRHLHEPALEVPEEQHPLPVGGVPVELVGDRVDVAVGDDEVEPAVVVVIGEGGPPAEERDARTGDARRIADVREEALAVVVVEDVVVVGEVRDVEVVAPVVVVVADGHAHVGLLAPRLVQGRARGVADVLERAVAAVAVEVVRRGVVGHEEIEPAVVVEVEEGDAEAVEAGGVGHARPRAHVGERAAAVVAEEVVALALQAARSAHHGLAAVFAVGRARGVGRAHAALLRRGRRGGRRVARRATVPRWGAAVAAPDRA